MPHEEQQYLQMIRDIDSQGTVEQGRNGPVRTKFGQSMRFSLQDGQLPILTTKQILWRSCWKELMWFIRGSTNVFDLHEQGVHIWDNDWRRGGIRGDGDLGPIYGHQWRRFNSNETNPDCDQLQSVIRQLGEARNAEKPYSRRIIMSAWNPCQISEMALPPCHVMCQFHVTQNKYLSCALYQRSGDVGLGVPFNILSYAFLTHLLAHHCQLEACEFVHFLGDAHIYECHLESLREQTERIPHPFPKIRFKELKTDIEQYCLDDIEWMTPYVHEPFVKLTLL